MASEKSSSFLVHHNGHTFDIGPFLSKHPGGTEYLKPYRNKSVTSILNGGYGTPGEKMSELAHSEAAKYLLQQYLTKMTHTKNGTEPVESNTTKLQNGFHQNGFSKANGHVISRKTEDIEDMEYLVNWDKPMLGQVSSLGAQYERWVNFPVERKLRLFGPSYLEELTKSRWYFVPIVWVPVAITFIIMHLQAGYSEALAVLGLILGVLNWTLLEYSLHRWVFHLTPGNNPILITTHFLIHGLHHKVPFDNQRLVFPPFPAGILCVILYTAYSKVLPLCILDSMAAGTVIGYICYDLTHYYLHFGAPKPNSHMYNMKRYHNRHHFSHHDLGYGITSALWDKVFGTTIILHKLAKAIKW